MKSGFKRRLSTLFIVLPMILSGCTGGGEEHKEDHKDEPKTASIVVKGGTGGGTYEIGSQATITATIPEYKSFNYWECDYMEVSRDNPYTFTVTEDATYEAIFKSLKGKLTVVGGSGSGEYNLGSDVTVTANTVKNYKFNHWEIDGESVSTSSTYTFKLIKDTTITAVCDYENELKNYVQTVTKKKDKDFKILTLTDIQLHDGESTDSAFAVIDQLYAQESPDMIVFLGDMLNDSPTYKSVTNCQAVINKIDSLNIPWAPIFGNHDHEDYQAGYESMKTTTSDDLAKMYKDASNCLYMDGPANVPGKSNYIVNIVEEDSTDIYESLIFVDSRLGGLEDAHADFYKDAVGYAKELNNKKDVKSVLFTHIALPEYGNALEASKKVEYRDIVGIYGRNPCDLASGSTKVFEAIKQLGSTTTVVCGHDHENAYYLDYEGVTLAYSMKSSYGDKHENPAGIGGAVVTIGNDTTVRYAYAEVPFKVNGALTINSTILGYWRYSGASLKVNMEINGTGTGRFSLLGTNTKNTAESEKEQLGSWNRLTVYVNLNFTNKTANYGSFTQISDNKYEYSLDLATIPLNTSGSELADGEETMKIIYFDQFSTSGDVNIGKCYFDIPEVTETDQADLKDATVSFKESEHYYNFSQPVRPEITVTLNSKTLKSVDDIFVKYENNREIGTATLTITPSGKGAHKYKGSISKTFEIIVNPDADTMPGHENAILINDSYVLEKDTFVNVHDWHNSGISLVFECKRMSKGTKQSGETFSFSLCGKNSNPGAKEGATSNWNRLSAQYKVNLAEHKVLVGESEAPGVTVTDLGDGWYRYEIALNSVVLNESGEGAMGNANETLTLCYIHTVTRSFKLDKVGTK